MKMPAAPKVKICDAGHTFIKSSDCPVCPECEKANKPGEGFLSLLGAPARRALQNNGITTLDQLSQYSVKELLQFHGLGPSSIPRLTKSLKEAGLNFKK
jgi:hypothetical protein